MRQGQKRGFARRLRRDMTDAERRLWYFLRNRALLGWKFRRQVPIGPYIADFACLEARLILELDGGHHTPVRDAARTAALQALGFRLLRFWDNDALLQTEAVLDAIARALPGRCPHPSPFPAIAGEGQTEAPPR